MKNGEQEIASELRTFYARTNLKDVNVWNGDYEVQVTFMNKRGVFEVNMPSANIPSHDQVVAITFDPKSRTVGKIMDPATRVVFLRESFVSESFDDIELGVSGFTSFPTIRVRGYWKNPNR